MSKEKHFAVIIPGLGDGRARFEFLSKGWESLVGVTPIVYAAGWSDKTKTYSEVMAGLMKQIGHLKKGGNTVSVLGASAGGALAFNALLDYPDLVANAVDICGRLKVGNTTGFRSFRRRVEGNLAFAESVQRFEARIPEITPEMKQRMLITRSRWDELVPPETLTVEGIQTIRLSIGTHWMGINASVCLFTTGANVLRFIKTATP